VKLDEIQLSSRQFQILLGSGFGDGHFKRHAEGNTYFSTNCGLRDKDYLLWKYNELQSIRLFNKPSIGKRTKYFGNAQFRWLLRSRRSHTLNQFFGLFYKGNKKVVNEEALGLLNELGLAVWYMDDGSLGDWKGYYKIRLCTQCFTYEDHLLMAQWFADTWGLGFKVNLTGKSSRYWLVLNKKEEVNRFLNLVRPHVISCMDRKIVQIKK